MPVTKTPIPNSYELVFDPREHSRHTLFCGTQVIQTRYYGSEKVLAVVIRTGFTTAKGIASLKNWKLELFSGDKFIIRICLFVFAGGLVRSILYPPPVDFRFEKDSYRFVALLAGIASFGFVYTIITKVSYFLS